MSTLLLRLAGVTQAWHSHRQRLGDTPAKPASGAILVPTRGGIAGFLGAALGRRRSDDLADLRSLHMLIRVDQPGRPRPEFRVSTRPARANSPAGPAPIIETVLDDAAFLVGVSGDSALIAAVGDALVRPAFPLYLGQRCYPPTLPIHLGVGNDDVETAIRRYPWIAAPWHRKRRNLRVALDIVAPGNGRDPRDPTPPLGPPLQIEPVFLDNPDSTEIDWMAAL